MGGRGRGTTPTHVSPLSSSVPGTTVPRMGDHSGLKVPSERKPKIIGQLFETTLTRNQDLVRRKKSNGPFRDPLDPPHIFHSLVGLRGCHGETSV